MGKTNYLSLLLATMGCFAFASCSDDPDADGKGGNNGGASSATVKPSRMDLSDATALTLVATPPVSKSDAQTNTLFKMDADGRLTAATVTMVVGKDGNTVTERTGYTIHPKEIHSISGAYTYLYDCTFADSKGSPADNISTSDYGDSGSYLFNILVANANGKIYYVPSAAHSYFPPFPCNSAIDRDGNIFLNGESHLAKLTFTDDAARLAPYGPEDKSWSGDMTVLDNGTIAFLSYYNSMAFVYPNGGYEYLDGSSENPRESSTSDEVQKDRYTYSVIDGKILAVCLPKDNFRYDWVQTGIYSHGNMFLFPEVEARIVGVNVGNRHGGLSYTEPLASIKGTCTQSWADYYGAYNWDKTSWTQFAREDRAMPIFDGGRYYFLSDVLAYEKNTGRWIDLVAEGTREHIIFPTSNNVFRGKAWQICADISEWFDVEKLEYGQVPLPILNGYEIISITSDIPAGKVYWTVLSPVDGKKHLLSIDITTGEYTESEIGQNREIISLIPLN